VRGRYHLIPRDHAVLGPDNLGPLTTGREEAENPANGGAQAAPRGEAGPAEGESTQGVQPAAFKEIKDQQ